MKTFTSYDIISTEAGAENPCTRYQRAIRAEKTERNYDQWNRRSIQSKWARQSAPLTSATAASARVRRPGLHTPQDGQTHRAISLMYCYYPLDKTWPVRARDAFADQEVSFQWDYPYDDYFTYKGGIGGTTDGEPFTCMKERPPPRSGRYPHHDYRPQPHRRLPY